MRALAGSRLVALAVKEAIFRFGGDAVDLLRQCLRYNAAERLSARKMLAHRYFEEAR